jgi:cyclin E
MQASARITRSNSKVAAATASVSSVTRTAHENAPTPGTLATCLQRTTLDTPANTASASCKRPLESGEQQQQQQQQSGVHPNILANQHVAIHVYHDEASGADTTSSASSAASTAAAGAATAAAGGAAVSRSASKRVAALTASLHLAENAQPPHRKTIDLMGALRQRQPTSRALTALCSAGAGAGSAAAAAATTTTGISAATGTAAGAAPPTSSDVALRRIRGTASTLSASTASSSGSGEDSMLEGDTNIATPDLLRPVLALGALPPAHVGPAAGAAAAASAAVATRAPVAALPRQPHVVHDELPDLRASPEDSDDSACAEPALPPPAPSALPSRRVDTAAKRAHAHVHVHAQAAVPLVEQVYRDEQARHSAVAAVAHAPPGLEPAKRQHAAADSVVSPLAACSNERQAGTDAPAAAATNQFRSLHNPLGAMHVEPAGELVGATRVAMQEHCASQSPQQSAAQLRAQLRHVVDGETRRQLSRMLQVEITYEPSPTYMDRQANITARMRAILVDWMGEVCDEFKLRRETLHLAVNYVDRFLSEVDFVARSKLQLVGVTALFVAAKLEEITVPAVQEFVATTDNTYTVEHMHRMERFMLRKLNFRLNPISLCRWTQAFLRRKRLLERPDDMLRPCSTCGVTCIECMHNAYDPTELVRLLTAADQGMLDIGFIRFPYSMIAAAVMMLLVPGMRHDTLHSVTGFTEDQLAECVTWLQPFVHVAHSAPTCRRYATNADLNGAESSIEAHLLQRHRPEALSLYMQLAAVSAVAATRTPASQPATPGRGTPMRK